MAQTITCAFCETTQPNAWYCVTCGLALHAIPAPTAEDAPPEGFEATLHDTSEAPELEVAPLLELETTHYDPALALSTQPLPGLETTQVEMDGGAEISFEPEVIPGFEPTSEDSGDGLVSGPVPRPSTCEWCGFPQSRGRLCNACGRSRTRVLVEEQGAKSRNAQEEEHSPRRCAECGSPVIHGQACRICGASSVPRSSE